MRIFANPERKGIAVIFLGILILGAILSIMYGGLEKYLNVTWFSGPSISGKIVFISEKSGTPDVYMMPKDGGEAVEITNGVKSQGIPIIAPNARKIVFVGEIQGSNSIYGVRGDGKSLVQLTEASGPKSNPEYSTDGKTIAYIASGKVYVADLNGANPKSVLPTREEETLAITHGEGMPTYTQYALEKNGEGILAACETSPDVQVLTYLTKPDGESARIPLSADPNERAIVTSIKAIPGSTSFVVSANVGSVFVLLFLDPKSGESHPIFRIKNMECGNIALTPDGENIIAPLKKNSNKPSYQLVSIPISGGSARIITNQHILNPCIDASGSKILATISDEDEINRDIVEIDMQTGDIKKLTNDGKSYNGVYTPELKE